MVIDKLLRINPNLTHGVWILIDGLKKCGDKETLRKWDEFRDNEEEGPEDAIFSVRKRETIETVLSHAVKSFLQAVHEGQFGQEYLENKILLDALEEAAYTIEENAVDWYIDDHGLKLFEKV